MKAMNKIRLLLMLFVVVGLALFIAIHSGKDSRDKLQEDPLLITNITQLNSIKVKQVVVPKTTEEIVNAIMASTGAISIGGGRYSQGGRLLILTACISICASSIKWFRSIKKRNSLLFKLEFVGAIFRTT